jgi:hypothetical protein
MGAWGTGIFQDDTACDIRDDYKDHLGNGLSGPPPRGRLDETTLEQALRVVDSGADLIRWAESPDLAKRRTILEKLRAEITSPQPAKKKVRKQVRSCCDWPVGAVIAYRLISGNLAILRVIGYHTDKGGTAPVGELLDWTGTELPSRETLQSAEIKEGEAFRQKIHRLLLFGLNKDAAKRIVSLDFTLEPFHEPICPQTVVRWKDLGQFLKKWFQLE